MDEIYMITGVTGFLGRTIAKKLLRRGKSVAGLRMEGDEERLLPEITYCIGDITKPETLKTFFLQSEGKNATLIHCAGIVTIASRDEEIWAVNVDGTRNIVDLCEKYHIAKLVYVSSVHAIAERRMGQIICETDHFSASRVKGIYGKSKAEATAYVKKAAERGLYAMTVHPSGIIGPEDYTKGYITEAIKTYLKGYLLYAIEGGYDFVDVRDVAEGVLQCIQRGKRGESYILSNEYVTVRHIFDILSAIEGKKTVYGNAPLMLLKWIAPICEKIGTCRKQTLLITPYSVYTLGSNGKFSHEKADRELGYKTRPIEVTLADMVRWIEKNKKGGKYGFTNKRRHCCGSGHRTKWHI